MKPVLGWQLVTPAMAEHGPMPHSRSSRALLLEHDILHLKPNLPCLFAKSFLCNQALNNLGNITSALGFRSCWGVLKGCYCQRQLQWIIPGNQLLYLLIYLDLSLISLPVSLSFLSCILFLLHHITLVLEPFEVTVNALC